MVECNPSEGIFNNVFGTLNMAQAAQAAGDENLQAIRQVLQTCVAGFHEEEPLR